MVRAAVIPLSVTKGIYDFIVFLPAADMRKKELPENVRDVYSREEYGKYIRCRKDCARSDTVHTALHFIPDIMLPL